MSRTMLFAATLAASVATAASAAEVLANGDFEAGNTGFYSDYAYSPGGLTAPSVYAIGTSPALFHGAWANYGDHTTGSGEMMIVNGATEPAVIWGEKDLAVTHDTNYLFTGWIASSYPGPASLLLRINGAQVGGAIDAPSSLGVWQSFQISWFSGSSTSADVALANASTGFVGNDFALDDLSFVGSRPVSTAPEPAAWALMIAGFGGAGAMLRRRRALPA